MTPWVTRRGMPAPGMARPAEPPELARPPRRSGAFARLATQSPRSRRDAAAIGRFRTARPDASTLPYPARPAFRWLTAGFWTSRRTAVTLATHFANRRYRLRAAGQPGEGTHDRRDAQLTFRGRGSLP